MLGKAPMVEERHDRTVGHSETNEKVAPPQSLPFVFQFFSPVGPFLSPESRALGMMAELSILVCIS